MRNLIGMYNMGTGNSYIESAVSSNSMKPGQRQNNAEMFVVENMDRDITSSDYLFAPDISFMGAKKNAPILHDFIDFVQRTISADTTDQIQFLGEFSRWCKHRIHKQQIKLIDAKLIGVKTMENRPVLVEDWLGEHFVELYPDMFGIYIPIQEIMKRTKYQWFVRLSQQQLLEATDLTLCKYILLACRPDNKNNAQNYLGYERTNAALDNAELKQSWLAYWQVPSSLQLWGMKPNNFGGPLVKTQTMQASMNALNGSHN